MAKSQPKSVSEIIQELWALLKAYAKQETIDPVRNLGRYLAWGTGGSLLISIGLFFLGLSALRALQTETGHTFRGFWSWAPYLIVALALGVIIGLAVRRILRAQHREHRNPA